ncbi:DUF4376 domain-containing protein [Acidovorax sp. Leaf78]|uniref:DUF4376 domain-containing protein n=1 Tax=Acidovorax sp. Leaf78 TaxID=1736237 RepID=UPI001F284C1B|nr:DUF4376 domain-containing protein [Acidovorax sp. Leaf78]
MVEHSFQELRSMRYVHTTTLAVATLDELRRAHPQVSMPAEGADLSDLGYQPLLETPATVPPTGFKTVQIAPVFSGGAWRTAWAVVPLTAADFAERTATAWAAIKAERDRRAAMGVKVGAHWFHSDEKSRIQQLGLVLLGQAVPAGLQWKTLTFGPSPVFVPMTPALAVGIVQSTAASDTAIFTAAEIHRMTMQASPDPGAYDFTAGWPASIEDEAHDAGFQFDSANAA